MRYHIIDNIRGLVFVSMFAFHTVWDLTNMFGVSMPWFDGAVGHVWQQSILWAFILISGFCWGMGHHQAKRGVIVFAAGALVSAVTAVVMPNDPVVFGVLTFMGAAMLVLCVFKQQIENVPALPALIVCVVLFALTRDVPYGYLGFETLHIFKLPGELYANLTSAFFGFQPSGFTSSDYVPFIPWIFLYLCGYFAFRAWPRNAAPTGDAAPAKLAKASDGAASDIPADAAPQQVLALPQQGQWPIVNYIGRHSLEFYLLHQVVIYAALSAIFAAIK